VTAYQVRSGTTIATDNMRITDPAREIVDPPPRQDQRKGES
jgi:formate dehydrogenase major subunit